MARPERTDNRIGRLDHNTIGYYRRVNETLEEGFPDQEEKGIFCKLLTMIFAILTNKTLKPGFKFNGLSLTLFKIIHHLCRLE